MYSIHAFICGKYNGEAYALPVCLVTYFLHSLVSTPEILLHEDHVLC